MSYYGKLVYMFFLSYAYIPWGGSLVWAVGVDVLSHLFAVLSEQDLYLYVETSPGQRCFPFYLLYLQFM